MDRRQIVAALVGSLAAVNPLFAQAEPGSRVRVTATAFKTLSRRPLDLLELDRRFCFVGNIVSLDDARLVVKLEGIAEPIEVPRRELRKLEVSHGRPRNWAGGGAGIGLLAGAVVGAVLGGTTGCDGIPGCGPPVAAASAFVFGALGTGVGFVVGAAASAERWETVRLERLRVGLAPTRSGALGVSLSFSF